MNPMKDSSHLMQYAHSMVRTYAIYEAIVKCQFIPPRRPLTFVSSYLAPEIQ